ncbi:MAG: hypothetical protein WBB60_00660 [Nitrospira sp.]|jgi:hypothetical protein|nr:hypothetical protein [Nitrospira sp.]MBP6607608.1 hypothetical protein [Nitrospira sp.]MCI1280524.1 hypothetical protein [Nitrospira sp.]HQV45428.1 hypothetical protein [Nitrospira sp.]HQY57079.1 hypothetical protein [Nitrospira sp.]
MRGSVIALTGLLLMTGCAGLAETTRTAVIHEVKFEEHLNPADLTVRVGDEVRWVNHRTLPVRIDIPGLNKDMLSCERDFSNFIGQVGETAELSPSKSTSLCFSKGMVISYNARMKSAVPGGMVIEPGTIRVVGPTQ